MHGSTSDGKKPGCPVYAKLTVVSVARDEQRNAWIVKAEGGMGTRMSWFSLEGKPGCAPGDEFAVYFDWK